MTKYGGAEGLELSDFSELKIGGQSGQIMVV